MDRPSIEAMGVTIRQVARHAGVSPMTVSNVLRDRAGTFRSETRDKVLAAARDLGYRASALPTAMRTGTFNLVALIAAAAGGYKTWAPTELLDAISDTLHDAGKHLLYCKIHEDHLTPEADPEATPRLFRETQADGLLVNGMHHERHERLARVVGSYPTVFLNSSLERDAVHPDDHRAGREAARLLRARKRRKLGYFCVFRGGHYSMDDRLDGFLAACGDRSPVVVHPNEHGETSFPRPDWDEHSERLFEAGCDGIFTYCRIEGEYLAQRAMERGLGPRDLTIVTVGEVPLQFGLWRLPTLILPMAELGRVGTGMLLRKLEHRGHEPTVSLAVSLVDGD